MIPEALVFFKNRQKSVFEASGRGRNASTKKSVLFMDSAEATALIFAVSSVIKSLGTFEGTNLTVLLCSVSLV
jgi:hypothetical protein